jgi:voltage-gated sodium channel
LNISARAYIRFHDLIAHHHRGAAALRSLLKRMGIRPPANGEDTSTSAKQPSGRTQVFMDAAAIKEKLKQNMEKKPYDVTDFYCKTGFAQQIARSWHFEVLTLCVICINAFWMAYDTDMNEKDVLIEAEPQFQVMEHFFCAYFSFEWVVRFISFESKSNCRRDSWFVFDSVLVLMMVIETWVMTIIIVATGAKEIAAGLGDASILRMVRLLRLLRMAKMARSVPELLFMVKGMAAAVRSVAVTLVLLGIIIYVYGIIFTQLPYHNTDLGIEIFKSVGDSMHALIIYGTFLDDLADLAFMLQEESIPYLVLFYTFVLLSALTLLNMLVGVLCEVVSGVAVAEREEITMNFVRDQFMKVIEDFGLECGPQLRITKDFFLKLLSTDIALKALREIEVDIMSLIDIADFIFVQLDDDDGDKRTDGDIDDADVDAPKPLKERTLTFGEFMDIILQLRGKNITTVRDIVDLRKLIHKESRSLHGHISRLEDRLQGRRFTQVPDKRAVSSPSKKAAKQAVTAGKETPASTEVPAKHLELTEVVALRSDDRKPVGACAASSTPTLALTGSTRTSESWSGRIGSAEARHREALLARTLWLERSVAGGRAELHNFLELVPMEASAAVLDAATAVASTQSIRPPTGLRYEAADKAAMSELQAAMAAGAEALQRLRMRLTAPSASVPRSAGAAMS